MRVKKQLVMALCGMTAALFILLITTAASFAENTTETSPAQLEIVFLLDTSGSMNTQDQGRLAIDAIRQAAYSMPSSSRVGVVAYNTGIQAILPFGATEEQMEEQLAALTYNGYTNAGEGLNQAVALFPEQKLDQEEANRQIIMISDGEIDMPDNAQREASRVLYTQAASLARERGIKICIIAVGSELNDPQMHIFDGAELTDGIIYWEGQSGSLSEIMDRITSDRLGFPRQSLGVTDSNGGTVHTQLPQGVNRAKLFVIGDSGIGQVTADYTAKNGRTTVGQRFAVVDMYRPSGAADIRFITQDLSNVRAYLMTEYAARPDVTVTYRIEPVPQTGEEMKKDTPPKYKHFADVTVELMDAGESRENLLAGEAWEGREIAYLLNGTSYTGLLQQGKIRQSIPADGISQVEVSVDTNGLGAIYDVEQPVTVDIPKTPDPPFDPPPDYRPLWIILGFLAAAMIGLGFWWLKKSRTTVIYVAQPPASREPAKKMETKACTYSGKLNLYVVRTADGRDVPPQTYRLFGRNSGRLTLDQILNTCKVKLGKIGEEDIIFYPGPDHSLLVMDQSERCTVLRGMELLKKGMGYPVYYNEKLTISFEDEHTEMEIHYKDLKPSEREGGSI